MKNIVKFLMVLMVIATLQQASKAATETIEDAVFKIAVQVFAVRREEITSSTSLVEDLGAEDSVLLDFVEDLELEFDIEIPDEQAEKIITIQDAIDYVKSRLE